MGVLSTTADKAIALDYVHKFARTQAAMGRMAGGIVFETKMGIVDRGAELEWLSQVESRTRVGVSPTAQHEEPNSPA